MKFQKVIIKLTVQNKDVLIITGIKQPLEHHLLCLNYSKQYKLFNSHCHYFCSNINLEYLDNKVDLEYCLTMKL